MSTKMYTEGFQDVEDFCGKCQNLQEIYEKKKANTMTLDDLGKFRYVFRRVIYKNGFFIRICSAEHQALGVLVFVDFLLFFPPLFTLQISTGRINEKSAMRKRKLWVNLRIV